MIDSCKLKCAVGIVAGIEQPVDLSRGFGPLLGLAFPQPEKYHFCTMMPVLN